MFGTADVAQLLLRGALEPVDAPLLKVGEHRKHFSMGVLQTEIINYDVSIVIDAKKASHECERGTQESVRYQARSSTRIFLLRAAKLNSVATRCCR